MIDGNVVLDFYVISDGHAGVNVDALADNAVFSDVDVLPHLGMVPDTGTFTNLGLGGYFSSWMYSD
jgi:hypothetical protein